MLLSIFRMIPVRTEESVESTIHRLPDEVWTVINDVEKFNLFWAKAQPAKQIKTSPFEFSVLDSQGKVTGYKYKILKYDRPNYLVLRIPNNMGIDRIKNTVWTFTLINKDDNTILRIEEDGNLAGWLVTGIFTSFGFETNLKDFMRSLKQHMEPE